eukprot:IDg1315t1
MLQSQLFGRARDLCKGIPSSDIQSPTGTAAIVRAVYKRDPLTVVSEVYYDFLSLLNLKRGSNESFKGYESRFEAQVSKFNAHSQKFTVPEALTAFMLLANSGVDSGQRISVLAAAAPSEEKCNPETSKTDDYLAAVSYRSIASVLRQCDKMAYGQSSQHQNGITSHNANTTYRKGNNFNQRHARRRRTPAEIAEIKSKSTCRKCGQIGHWHSDHNPDGTLNPSVKSSPPTSSNASGSNKKSITFNMANISSNSCSDSIPADFVGPLLDDGAPYSGIGLSEFRLLQKVLIPDWKGKFDSIPTEIAESPFWQYGTGNHASESRRILGSVVMRATLSNSTTVDIRHLIIEGSSQWLIGRNVTKHCDIVHIGGNYLRLPENTAIKLKNHGYHSYVPYELFMPHETQLTPLSSTKIYCATAQIAQDDVTYTWKETKMIIDKVHRHVCGHSTYTDMKILLDRNGLLTAEAQKYLSRTLEKCTSCSTTHEPKQARKVSLSSMSRAFNNVVCIDHFHLDDYRVCHIMDSVTRYSVGKVVSTTSMIEAIEAFESHWISAFWTPDQCLFDQAFNNDIFKNYLLKLNISPRAIPSRRHNKNVLESKHRIIRDIYIRLKHQYGNDSDNLASVLVQRALRISNDLYGNDVMSANELAKGYTRPILTGQVPEIVPNELLEANSKLQAKRKLTLILRSKSTSSPPISIGDTVQVYIKRENEKRGKWSSPKPVLEYDKISHTVSVPGNNGRKIRAAVEDTRVAIQDNALAVAVQEAIDTLNFTLDNSIDSLISTTSMENTESPELDLELNCNDSESCLTEIPGVGQSIEVFWPDDNQYYRGKVSAINESDGKYTIDYDDGDQEIITISNEVWRMPNCNGESIHANEVTLPFEPDLKSNLANDLDLYYEMFGNKEFLSHHSEGLPTYAIQNAYVNEEQNFMKTVRAVHVTDVPLNANIITSHVIYNVKTNDDNTKKMKARIAPHGNKDKEKTNLKTDSATCPPIGIRILISIAVINKWSLAKIDFKSAFLQSGNAMRDVYVVPPRECNTRSHYWLLLTATYGLVNANSKWQEISDELLRSIGYKQLVYVPQVFYIYESNELKAAAVKVVDDVLFAGPKPLIQNSISKIQSQYELGTVLYGPGTFLFYGLTICQNEDMHVTVHADNKLEKLEAYPIDRHRRKQSESLLNAIEMGEFRSLNSSIGWLGIAVSPFCSFYASYLQQKAPKPLVKDLILQINSLRLLKKLGTSTKYLRPQRGKTMTVSVLVFSDASRTVDHGQLSYICGLLFGDMKCGSIFHTISWVSHKSKRPVKSIGSAEILAAGEAIDEGKNVANAYQKLLGLKVDLIVVVDSKDLFTTLSTCRNATDRSIRGDVSVIRYEFETKNLTRLVWIPGNINIADPGTKTNSPLTGALQLLLAAGEISIDLSSAQIKNSDQSTG